MSWFWFFFSWLLSGASLTADVIIDGMGWGGGHS